MYTIACCTWYMRKMNQNTNRYTHGCALMNNVVVSLQLGEKKIYARWIVALAADGRYDKSVRLFPQAIMYFCNATCCTTYRAINCNAYMRPWILTYRRLYVREISYPSLPPCVLNWSAIGAYHCAWYPIFFALLEKSWHALYVIAT